jgi:hypothetical protein
VAADHLARGRNGVACYPYMPGAAFDAASEPPGPFQARFMYWSMLNGRSAFMPFKSYKKNRRFAQIGFHLAISPECAWTL